MTSGTNDSGEITQVSGAETAVLAGGCFWGMQDLIRRRQKARALVMALLLGAFVILVFAIALTKIRQGMA